nr:energy transducer TonB [Acidobacteriota bacterium]
VMTLIVPSQAMPPMPPPLSGGESRHTLAHVRAAVAPSEAPTATEPELAGAAAAPDTGPGVPGGMPGGDIRSILGSLPDVPPPPVVMSTQAWRVGGQIRNPAKTRDLRPVYPPIAVASRVERRVMIEAIIGADGRVKDATVLRSIPLLDQAALAAVRQWQFTPTLLNGVPPPSS